MNYYPFVVKSSALILVLVWALPAFALNLSTDDEPARQAALQWLQVIDSGNYQDAAQQITGYARGSRDWLKYFGSHRARLGDVKNRHVMEVKHAGTIPGDPELRQHAIIRFKTSFEHKAVAIEEVVMTKMGCCWEVGGYEVN